MIYPARSSFPLWAGCLLLVLLASVFGRPDIPIDETRYVSVAWEMWTGGDWLVMHRNGEPYHHKPPLLFWLIGLGWGVFGVNDWWPRCISAIFSLVSLGLTVAIARRLWPRGEDGGRRIGERAGWLLLGGAFWLFFSTAVVFDIMLTACALLALLGGLRAWHGERRGTWGLFGLAVGLGVLAKGPVVLLPVLPPLLLAPWWGGRAPAGWYKGLGLGFLLGAGVALAWAVPAAIFGGEEFRQAIFWGQTAGRMSGTLAHRQPFWFYVALLPLLLFPWFFWGRAWRGLLGTWRDRGSLGTRFCLAWIFPAFIVLSLSGGKQAHYLMPLLPACALLIAAGWPEAKSGRLGMLPLAIVLAVFGGLLLKPELWAGRFWFAPRIDAGWTAGGVLLLLFAVALAAVGRTRIALPAAALASAGLVVVILLLVLRPLAPAFDMTPMGQRLKALEEADVPVAHASAYNAQYHFYGRLTRPLDQIGRGEIDAWLAAQPQGRVVAYVKRAADVETVRPEFWQPYLDGAVVLLDAESARRMPGREG